MYIKRRTSGTRFFLYTIVICFFCTAALGQKVTVRGGFINDSTAIGEQTRYYLTAQYPSKLNVVFPDSSYNFKPFEFNKKYYTPTKTIDSLSYDSAVYYISTFEIDRVQSLALPVFVISRKDSIPFYPVADSIQLIELVHHVPDSIAADKLPLKTNTAYQNVSMLFNYPILAIVIAAILIVALIVFLVFGKRIRKYFRVKRLRKNHQRFMEDYAAQLQKIKGTFSPAGAEQIMATWKKYLEQLEAKPYTKLTTKEISMMAENKDLHQPLQAIDKAIYGHDAGVVQPLENLRENAVLKFLKKLEDVNHG